MPPNPTCRERWASSHPGGGTGLPKKHPGCDFVETLPVKNVTRPHTAARPRWLNAPRPPGLYRVCVK